VDGDWRSRDVQDVTVGIVNMNSTEEVAFISLSQLVVIKLKQKLAILPTSTPDPSRPRRRRPHQAKPTNDGPNHQPSPGAETFPTLNDPRPEKHLHRHRHRHRHRMSRNLPFRRHHQHRACGQQPGVPFVCLAARSSGTRAFPRPRMNNKARQQKPGPGGLSRKRATVASSPTRAEEKCA
jgi:hypothetical protein